MSASSPNSPPAWSRASGGAALAGLTLQKQQGALALRPQAVSADRPLQPVQPQPLPAGLHKAAWGSTSALAEPASPGGPLLMSQGGSPPTHPWQVSAAPSPLDLDAEMQDAQPAGLHRRHRTDSFGADSHWGWEPDEPLFCEAKRLSETRG